MYNLNTPIWQLTVGEFLELQQRVMEKEVGEQHHSVKRPEKELVYGLKGIAKLLGCSTTTAQTIKNSGVIDKAITQVGRKIVTDAELALKLINEKNKIGEQNR